MTHWPEYHQADFIGFYYFYIRRYREVLLHFLDENGKVNLSYGTDGISTSYEDTALLNYRKVESWDLLVDDILNLSLKYDID